MKIKAVIKFLKDLWVTLILWTYYIGLYFLFLFPLHIFSFLFIKNSEEVFQWSIHIFFRGFFLLMKTLIPNLSFHIDKRVSDLKSCVVISNHLSYLDPLLMISIFKRHKTIVKPVFFSFPVFGWLLTSLGYIPAMEGNRPDIKALELMEKLKEFFIKDGVLFVFPEGHRNQEGKVRRLKKGAFKIARYCNVPLSVLLIKNTGELFPPGSFLFDTGIKRPISLEFITTIFPDKTFRRDQIVEQVNEVQRLMESELSHG